ncbi:MULTISPECIES: filamentous hemagglutinin N-terminal domain-containing protein [unclassified Morganella (in: enterobacteria)]|uniref:two-partner secretion domain-containing protein n=1 Tax=unclassified Morganella (in: enterobacteria) TaxID=2676694 RepID=UPI002941DBA2|nr:MULTISPECIES: filamentous hemagglutinin N-terminal domain-containing protein [unclassified Morganella (in: enterobacteria)]
MQKIVKLSVISSALLLAQFASAAGITVNPVSAETTQVTRHKNKTTIDIAPANTHGVSYNAYDQFNVNKHGVVFNNREAGAGTIINEVLSTEKSQLRGNMHVDGKKAHLIIANPNGIACNGCSVSGAEKLTLAAGKAVISQEGEFLGYYGNTGTIRFNQINDDAFSSVQRLAVIAGNIDFRDSNVRTPNLTLFTGHELVKYIPSGIRDLEALQSDSDQTGKLTIRHGSRIKTDDLHISANNAMIKNHGEIETGPVNNPQKQRYMNSQLTMDLMNSVLTNGNKGIIRTTKIDSVLKNSTLTNNGNIQIDGDHKITAIGRAIINNKGNISATATHIRGLDGIETGVGINNHGSMSGSLFIKANTVALNNKKYLEALDIATDSDVLAYINDGEIMNETAKFRAYELYHSGNGKISSTPVFESEIKKSLP